MKIPTQTISLKNADEALALNALIDAVIEQERDTSAKAQRVFDAFCDEGFSDDVDLISQAHADRLAIEVGRWRKALDESIAQNLDHRTLAAFIEIVLASEAKARQALAANGRRQIGAASRAKVAKEATAFRHLSKGNAAHAIAPIVNLDAGTVKRYLSELFPGDKWK